MGNTNTTETAILNQIVKELQTVTGFGTATVFLSVRPLFLASPPGDRYIEVVPGVAQDENTRHTIGEMNDSFSVCVYQRWLGDQDQRDTAKIADTSAGILATVAAVETKLTNSFLAGLALVPVVPRRRDAAADDLHRPGWVMIQRHFMLKYRYAYPAAQSLS